MRFNNRRIPDINLNLNVRGLAQSATLAINERSAQLQRAGRQVFRFGLGQSPFPVPLSVVNALKENAHQKDYLPVKGLPELCEAVAGYYAHRQNIKRAPSEVLIGPGSKELMFLLQLVYYGDLVIPTPSWVSYAPQAHIIGRQVHWLQTHAENQWRLTPQELVDFCRSDPDRPRLVILNYPSNPTGGTYQLARLRELAQVARRFRLVLLSDEIYGELHHQGHHVSIARFYPEGTIISSGLSKWCGAGGWRLGTFVFPEELRWLQDAMAAAASETFTSTSAPIQYAAVRAFEGGVEIDEYLRQTRRILGALGRYLARCLTDIGVPVSMPQGAFYLFPDFSPFRLVFRQHDIHSSSDLCERILEETGVAMLPGSCFGRSKEELTMRLAYVDFDGGAALEAATQQWHNTPLDRKFLDEFCGDTVAAIGLLCKWIDRHTRS